MNKDFYCVIMAGGVGSRFWPLSRNNRPKQFIDILGTGETLIQQTFRRLCSISPPENIFVVTHADYFAQVVEQLPTINPEHVLCEPMRRNTAPCIAYAAYKINKINPGAKIVVAPSDHIILKEVEFTELITSALQAASDNDWLLTLGITPNRPDTGYGYIQFDSSQAFGPGNIVRKVKTFTEKPDLPTAQQFVSSGEFLWNSGIFVWSLASILKALNEYLPDVNTLFADGAEAYYTNAETTYIANAYTQCRSISIDYGIMEKAENVYVLAADIGWSDLGTWGSLYENSEKDLQGNVLNAPKSLVFDCANSIVALPGDKVAVLQGLDGYIVAEDKGILLVCRRNDEQQIRQFVDAVKDNIGPDFI